MRRVCTIALLLTTACYTYSPIDAARLQPGMNVRARVSVETAQRIEPLLGTQDARLLSGLLIDNAGDTLIVQVPTTVRTNVGSAMHTLQQRVSIPRSGILELEQSRLDRTRTTAITVAGVVAVAAVVAKIAIKGGGSLPPGGGGGPELRFPVFLRW
jgi:hypothetical protein